MPSPDRDAPEARLIDSLPPVEAEDYPWALAAAAQEDVPPPDQYPATETIAGAITTPNTAVPLTDGESAKPDWYAPYEALQRDWSKLIERVQQTGKPLFYAKGYADMIQRIQAVAENGQIPAEIRAPMVEALENHQRDLSARKYVEDYIATAERHMDTHASLQRVADGLGVPIVQISDHLGWRQEADRLRATAERLSSPTMRRMASISTIWKPAVHAWKGSYHGCVRSSGRMANMPPPEKNRNHAANLRIHGRKSNNRSPQRRPGCRSMKHLRQDWNSLIEDARQAGIPLFYAKGYMDIVVRVQTIAENPDIPAKSRAPLIQVLENHQHYLSTRKQILEYPGEAQRQMDARATLRGVVGRS